MQAAEVNRDEEIRQLAFNIWLEEGCPEGHDLQNWIKAETIWQEEHRRQSEPKHPAPAKGRKSRQPRTSARPD